MFGNTIAFFLRAGETAVQMFFDVCDDFVNCSTPYPNGVPEYPNVDVSSKESVKTAFESAIDGLKNQDLHFIDVAADYMTNFCPPPKRKKKKVKTQLEEVLKEVNPKPNVGGAILNALREAEATDFCSGLSKHRDVIGDNFVYDLEVLGRMIIYVWNQDPNYVKAILDVMNKMGMGNFETDGINADGRGYTGHVEGLVTLMTTNENPILDTIPLGRLKANGEPMSTDDIPKEIGQADPEVSTAHCVPPSCIQDPFGHNPCGGARFACRFAHGWMIGCNECPCLCGTAEVGKRCLNSHWPQRISNVKGFRF